MINDNNRLIHTHEITFCPLNIIHLIAAVITCLLVLILIHGFKKSFILLCLTN